MTISAAARQGYRPGRSPPAPSRLHCSPSVDPASVPYAGRVNKNAAVGFHNKVEQIRHFDSLHQWQR